MCVGIGAQCRVCGGMEGGEGHGAPGSRTAECEDPGCSDGVGENIEFAHWGDVAGKVNRAAHDQKTLGAKESDRVFRGCESVVGERAERDEGDGVDWGRCKKSQDFIRRRRSGGTEQILRRRRVGMGHIGCGRDDRVVGRRQGRRRVKEMGPGFCWRCEVGVSRADATEAIDAIWISSASQVAEI